MRHFNPRIEDISELSIRIPDFEKLCSRQVALVSLLETEQKFSQFSKPYFSAVSTPISILSSQNGRIQPILAPKPQNFRKITKISIEFVDAKSEKSTFVSNFRPQKKNSKKFRKKKIMHISTCSTVP